MHMDGSHIFRFCAQQQKENNNSVHLSQCLNEKKRVKQKKNIQKNRAYFGIQRQLLVKLDDRKKCCWPFHLIYTLPTTTQYISFFLVILSLFTHKSTLTSPMIYQYFIPRITRTTDHIQYVYTKLWHSFFL